jgi:hypothetical protein
MAKASTVVRRYRAKTPEQAAALFETDATEMAATNYFPVSQRWSPFTYGDGGGGLDGLGLLFLLVELVLSPFLDHNGTLAVTYQLQPPIVPSTSLPQTGMSLERCSFCWTPRYHGVERCPSCGTPYPVAISSGSGGWQLPEDEGPRPWYVSVAVVVFWIFIVAAVAFIVVVLIAGLSP